MSPTQTVTRPTRPVANDGAAESPPASPAADPMAAMTDEEVRALLADWITTLIERRDTCPHEQQRQDGGSPAYS